MFLLGWLIRPTIIARDKIIIIIIFNYYIIHNWTCCFQLILVSVLNAFYDAISLLLRKNVEKRALMDNLDGVMSIVDEIVDGGWGTFFLVLSQTVQHLE